MDLLSIVFVLDASSTVDVCSYVSVLLSLVHPLMPLMASFMLLLPSGTYCTFKALTPLHLGEFLQWHKPVRSLRSSNRLPVNMKSVMDLEDFKSLLKTYLFSLAFES